MVTEQKSIEVRIAELMAASVVAAQAGDLDKVIAIGREAASLKRGNEEQLAKATSADRDAVKAKLEASLPRFNLRELARKAEVTGTIRRSDSGLDDGKFEVVLPDLAELVWTAVAESNAVAVPSVKRIDFTIKGGKAEVTISHTSGSAKGSGGGSGGKGWMKDGVQYKLGDIFTTHATAEQKSSIEAMDGNDSYTLKKQVALAKGYSQNS